MIVTSLLGLGALRAAELLKVPAVAIGFTMHLEEYREGCAGEPVLASSRAGISRSLRRLRQEAGLCTAPLTLLRGHPALECPGAVLPSRVCHVGPLSWEPTADPDWVAHLLPPRRKPLAYVHLGRTFGGLSRGRCSTSSSPAVSSGRWSSRGGPRDRRPPRTPTSR